MPKEQPQFTAEEINVRLECLKIAAIHYKDEKEMCFVARGIYHWITTDGDPECFYDDVNDPDGILWAGAIPASNRPK